MLGSETYTGRTMWSATLLPPKCQHFQGDFPGGLYSQQVFKLTFILPVIYVPFFKEQAVPRPLSLCLSSLKEVPGTILKDLKLNSTQLTEQHSQRCHFLWNHGSELPQHGFCFPLQQRLAAPAQGQVVEAEKILCEYLSPSAVPTTMTLAVSWMRGWGREGKYNTTQTRWQTDKLSVYNFPDPITTLK